MRVNTASSLCARYWRCSALAGLAGLVGFVGGLAVARISSDGRRITTSLLSPDERYIARLVERRVFLDRNFVVSVESRIEGKASPGVVFRSPDEGKPIGSERFVWSNDGQYVLLLGRHFFVAPEHRLPSGEYPYLLYHVKSGRIWCNARQATTERFGATEISALRFKHVLSNAE